MKKLFIIFSILALVSCKSTKPVITGSSSTIVIEKQWDTVVYTRPDSSQLMAIIKCDSLGKVYLSEIIRLKTSSTIKPEIKVKENILTLNCIVDSLAVYVRMQKKYEKLQDTSSTVITVYRDKPKTAAHYFNGLLLFLLGAAIALGGYFYYLKKWA